MANAMPLVPTSLDLTIDRNSPIPLHFQLAQQFEAAIRSGQLPAGTRLDNEVQIALDLEVSRPTVRAAFLYLVNHGLVERKRGSGTVVIREKVNRTVQLSSLYDDLIAAGRTPVSRVLTKELVIANEVVAEALEIPLDSQVLVLARLRLVDDDPLALMRNYLPAEFAPLESSALETRGLYELLRAQGVRMNVVAGQAAEISAEYQARVARIYDQRIREHVHELW